MTGAQGGSRPMGPMMTVVAVALAGATLLLSPKKTLTRPSEPQQDHHDGMDVGTSLDKHRRKLLGSLLPRHLHDERSCQEEDAQSESPNGPLIVAVCWYLVFGGTYFRYPFESAVGVQFPLRLA